RRAARRSRCRPSSRWRASRAAPRGRAPRSCRPPAGAPCSCRSSSPHTGSTASPLLEISVLRRTADQLCFLARGSPDLRVLLAHPACVGLGRLVLHVHALGGGVGAVAGDVELERLLLARAELRLEVLQRGGRGAGDPGG